MQGRRTASPEVYIYPKGAAVATRRPEAATLERPTLAYTFCRIPVPVAVPAPLDEDAAVAVLAAAAVVA